ncbi:ADP-ribosyltransferase [Bacillus thuringiensis]|uniref:ADP-ribosyltransferase n=1 Tax=Bacillus thuringiensis TaxID=1428 RepID=UPI000C208C0D|nr:ADP-ribosyltransferase [Bacillus thuringiensis]MEB9695913.1 ADP-ribosyltransferase [Bacillus cereus]
MKISFKLVSIFILLNTMFSIIFTTPILAFTQTIDIKVANPNKKQKIIDFPSKDFISQAEQWGNRLYRKWSKTITEQEKKEIGYYAGVGYREINTYLRIHKGELSGENPNIEKKVAYLDHAFHHARLKDSIVVYRRVTEAAFGLSPNTLLNEMGQINFDTLQTFRKNYKGKMNKDAAYMSTSIIKDPVTEFSELPILLRIVLPKGVQAAYIAPLSPTPEELELLLPRGTVYKITNITPIIQKERQYVLVDAIVE